MLPPKNYSEMTTEDLVSEANKMKSQRIITAVFIGFLAGIAFYAAVIQKSFFLTIVLLFFAFLVGSRSSQKLKNIQAELDRRNTNLS